MIKINQEKILQENEYKLEIGLNYYRPQAIVKNENYLQGLKGLIWVLPSFVEFNKFNEEPETQFKALYIYAPYPDVIIGINNMGPKCEMIESKDLKFILAWLCGDVIFTMEGEKDET
jgi:hypothetical protein